MPLSRRLLLAAALLALSTAPVMAQDVGSPGSEVPQGDTVVKTSLKGLDGSDKGTADVVASPGGVMLKVSLTGVTPGWHGIHFHEKGLCEAEGKFASAGAHAAMKADDKHGLHSHDHGPHAGDLPNIWVGADGTGKAEFFTPFIDRSKLVDADGTALVVHAAADDYKSQPAGNAGDRIACGVLSKP